MVPSVQNTDKVDPMSIIALTKPWSDLEKKWGNKTSKLKAPITKPIIINSDDFKPCFCMIPIEQIYCK